MCNLTNKKAEVSLLKTHVIKSLVINLKKRGREFWTNFETILSNVYGNLPFFIPTMNID